MFDTEVARMLDQLQSLGKSLLDGDQAARSKVLDLCRTLTAELETPGETFIRTFWSNAAQNIAIRVAIDLDIFVTLSADNASPKTSAQLAAPKGAEPLLVARMMRHLAATGTVREIAPDLYTHSHFTRSLAGGPLQDAIDFDDYAMVNVKGAEFLKKTGWVNPTNGRDTALQYALGIPNTTYFEWMAQNPAIGARFGGMMTAQATGKPMWSQESFFPVERLSPAEGDDSVLLVDIGGGKGHDVVDFKARHPQAKGKLIVQEMPYMVEQMQGKLDGVEYMVHDFNAPQPVKGTATENDVGPPSEADRHLPGASAYFLHQILHDYDDETCRNILRQIIPAMKGGHSRILVQELVLADQGAHWMATGLDVELMLCLASRERTEGEFRQLANDVGLVVEAIWSHPHGQDSVIELVLPA